ncbi:MAG: DUF4038 domain-containing protein, partial [Clostridia bacterium]|nr:DUF4038 domain-containing protein [Clostridia bacterium]
YYSPYLNLKQYITEEGNYDITFRFKLEGAAAGTAFSGVIRTGGETSFSLKHGNNYYADLNDEINKSNGVWYTYGTTLTVLESDLNKGNYWNLGLHEIQGTVTAIYIDDVTVKKADNLIDSVNSCFDNVSDVSQLAWTTLGTITTSLVKDGNGGNALRYELQAGAGAYYTVLLDVSKYIRKSGDYKITFRYKVENSDENTKPFSGVLRTISETSFAGKTGDNYFAALAAADKVENDTWATYTAYLFVQAEDIGKGGEWNLGIHQLQSTITAVTIDDVTITSFAFEEEKPTVVTKAETWVANEMTLISDYYYSDPLNDATLDFVLTDGNVTYTVPGFWDGGNIWRVRFVCPTAGVWTYTTSCSNKGDKGLDGKSGTIACTAYSGELDIYKHGFIKETGRYFSYNDGTPFFYLGDTHWGLGSESIDMVETIAQNRVSQGFTVYQSEPIGANFNFADGISAADIYGLRTHDEKYRLIAENGLVHANASLFFSSSMMEFISKNGGFSDELIKTVHHDKSNLDIEIYDLSNEAKDQLEKITRYWVARYSAYPVMWTLAQEVDNDFYWDRDDHDGHEGWNYVNNPFKLVAEYIGAYDPYSSPLSAHMEDTGTTVASTSAFRDVKAHTWYAAQWKPTLTGGSLQAVAQDFWNNGQGKPVVNYEGRYCYLWTKHFGARAQGWMSYLSGMYGYGYGAQDTWCYTSSYSEDADSSDGVDTITKEEKQAATWLDAQTYESSYQVGYMHSFFKNTVGEWYDLIPRFDDAAYLERENGAYAVVASNQDNTKIVAYFYNFTDLTVGAKANTANGTRTGTFGNLIAGASYTYKWFDPRTNT